MNKIVLLIFSLLTISSSGFAQANEANLRKDLTYLASDKLGGRLTGTKYEQEASEYISKQFKNAGLIPMGIQQSIAGKPVNSWYQYFEFSKGLSYGKNNSFSFNGNKYTLENEYYPVPYSSEGNIQAEIVDVGYGINSTRLKVNTYEGMKNLEGKIFLINLSDPESGSDPRYAEVEGWRARLDMAKPFKPAGIIFYNSKEPLNLEAFKKFTNIQRENIILIHTSAEIIKKLVNAETKKVSISVNLENNKGTGHNVIGYIDNGKATTIVIGAHYDHLGMGELGNSLYTGKAAIHNGADDNGSGTVALMELARVIKSNGPTNHNYLFIAFSGEELGLVGSKYFTSNPTIPLEKIN